MMATPLNFNWGAPSRRRTVWDLLRQPTGIAHAIWLAVSAVIVAGCIFGLMALPS